MCKFDEPSIEMLNDTFTGGPVHTMLRPISPPLSPPHLLSIIHIFSCPFELDLAVTMVRVELSTVGGSIVHVGNCKAGCPIARSNPTEAHCTRYSRTNERIL